MFKVFKIDFQINSESRHDPLLCCHLVSKSVNCCVTEIWYLSRYMSKWISVSFLHLHQNIDPLKCNFQNIKTKLQMYRIWTCRWHNYITLLVWSVWGEKEAPRPERAGYLFSVGSQDAGSHRVKPAVVREITTNMITEHTGLEANRGRDKIPDVHRQFITINSSINSSEAKQKMTEVIPGSPWYWDRSCTALSPKSSLQSDPSSCCAINVQSLLRFYSILLYSTQKHEWGFIWMKKPKDDKDRVKHKCVADLSPRKI